MRGYGELGSGEIVDPRATEQATSPTGSVGEADFPPIGGPSLSTELTTTLLREEAGRP